MEPNEAEQKLIEKIRSLPPATAAEVEDFVDFLARCESERALSHAASRISENAFHGVWDNVDDADYDHL